MANKVVARYRDGRVLKGTGFDIDPNRPSFHLQQAEGGRVPVVLAELKALFFVKSLEGDPGRNDSDMLEPGDVRSRGLTRVRIVFEDGEAITGMTIRYPPNRAFWYMLPVDAKSNNIRILVNSTAVVSMEAQLDASAG